MRLIDRDIVIQRIKDKAAFYSHETAGDFDTGRKLGLIGAEEVIADMPIIDAEPVKHGKWVAEWKKRIYDNGDSWYAKSEVELRCSLCKAFVETFEWRKKDENANIPSLEKLFYQSQWERLNSRKTKYCPNCGARMDGDTNEEP